MARATKAICRFGGGGAGTILSFTTSRSTGPALTTNMDG